MAMRLISATGRPLAALALLAAVCACATTATEPSVRTRPPGWRIVERTGEARYLPPESAGWIAATTGQALAGGSEVATGRGGRLIVDAPGRHLSVGPDSRFVLAGGDREAWLEQRAGWLRYRIAGTGAPRFRIHTRSLELQLSTGVIDVQVDHLATEVTVKEGEVWVATPDGLRQTQMIAGQSARAGEAGGTVLAVRMAPDQPLQPIEPVVVPALQPKRPSAGITAAAAPAGSSTAVLAAPQPSATAIRPAVSAGAQPLGRSQSPAPQRTGSQPVPSDPPPAHPTSPRHDAGVARPAASIQRTAGPAGSSYGGAGAIGPAIRPNDLAAIRRSKLERLTAGALDGIQAPHPAPSERRSIR